jgi:intracellular sulfur oxidation DsrE/DsrF family protein
VTPRGGPSRRGLLAGALGLLALPRPTFAQEAGDAVVYHIDDARQQATRALRSLRNHLDIAPATRITVVTHGDGIDFLMEGAKDEKASIDYAGLIADLKGRGVRFEVCELTLRFRGLDRDQFVFEADFVPSGVVRVTELQRRNGHAYIKP